MNERIRKSVKLGSWVNQIARNAIIDCSRSQKTMMDIPAWLSQPEPDHSEKVYMVFSEAFRVFIESGNGDTIEAVKPHF